MDLFQRSIEIAAAKSELSEKLPVLEKNGLCLTEDEIDELVECRQKALRNTGRIEFGGGILPKLIESFADSPYLEQDDLVETLAELQMLFYDFKAEADETMPDDELIEMMVEVFNGRAQGATDWFSFYSLDELCRQARLNRMDDYDNE